ncbi:2-phospho-L-lactate guanylyltransferase [Salarchaeum sp. JOR-1]|uniref:2-phospho-L-lactate guanylyltransferase n=1 Tax=Salarchaeum sp. JOR-1 TaxID=2599399 RepID=UPI00119846F3|nr:2-phospho-L-lactate guanylyltransferase [Salarchaeum sp. JOR-1]QDX40556.1 2-phospho-L-lactate guanylyltransferase [Salarchaeum sp. JOR-1]
MRVLVPFDGRNPCSRLAPVLDSDERGAFAALLRDDVLDAVRAAGGRPELLATAPVDADVPVTVDDRSLSAAVNAVLDAGEEPTAVVMADLGLATPRALSRLFDASGDVVLAPGRGGGTNALVVRHSDFRVDYHGASCRDHRRAAHAVGASLRELDSHRLATDIDEPGDLAELLLHGDGRATRWLRDAGFRLSTGDGRVAVERHP